MKALLKASFWAGLTTGCRALSLLLIAKLVAIYVGPDGLGKIGQFLSLMTIFGVLAGGGVGNGLIRYVAEYRESLPDLKRYVGTAMSMTLTTSIIVGIGCLALSPWLSEWILGSNEYVGLIWILCGAQFAIAGHNFLLGLINGHKDASGFAIANLAGLILGLVATSILTVKWHLYGTLIGLMVLQASPMLFSTLIVKRARWFKKAYLSLTFDKSAALQLARYSGMAIAPAIITPFTQIFIRDMINDRFGWTSVGYWQASTRISDVIMIFVATTLSVHYLPRLAEAKSDRQLQGEVTGAFKVIVPMVATVSVLIFAFRSQVIPLLFSGDFAPVESLMGPQLLGDVLRVCSWLLSYLMLAKSMLGMFIITEIVSSAVYLVLTWYFLDSLGLIGAIWASAATASFYLMMLSILLRKYYSLRSLVGLDNRTHLVQSQENL